MKLRLEEGLEIEVRFYYQPYEPPETGPEALYPGCSASIDDIEILYLHKGDINDLVYFVSEEDNFYRYLEEQILEKILDENNDY